MRETLKTMYLTYLNDYLTVERFAEDNNIDADDMHEIIRIARKMYVEDEPKSK